MNKSFDYIIYALTSKEGYTGLFKAGIVLISAALIAVSQSAGTIEGMDSEFYKSKFEYEAKIGKKLEAIDCVNVAQDKPLCSYLKHQQKKLESGVDLLNNWVNLASRSGLFLIFASLVLMFFHPYNHNSATKDA